MREYTIKFLDSDGEIENESHIFQLENSATVSILKEAFQKEVEEYKPDQLRLFFRKENGQKIGLDNDDILSEVIGDQAGQILAECEPLGVLSGKIWIHKDFNEEVFVLVGTPKRFDHYKVYRSQGSNYTVPISKLLQFLCKNQHYTCLIIDSGTAKLDFIWAHNKVAIVEHETRREYITFQYHIENGWKLLVCKNDKVNAEDPSWTLKRIEADGTLVILEGKKKTYFDSRSKNPKQF